MKRQTNIRLGEIARYRMQYLADVWEVAQTEVIDRALALLWLDYQTARHTDPEIEIKGDNK
jgi:hypothetical protein